MDASTQHTKIETVLAQAREKLAHADLFLAKTQDDYDMLGTKIMREEQESHDAHAKLDSEIKAELESLTKAADTYIEAIDALEEAV